MFEWFRIIFTAFEGTANYQSSPSDLIKKVLMKQKPFLSHGIEINKAHLVQWLEIYSHCIPPFHLAVRKYLPLSHVCKSVRSDFVQTWKRGKKHIFVPVNSSHTSGFTFYLLQHILFKATGRSDSIAPLPQIRNWSCPVLHLWWQMVWTRCCTIVARSADTLKGQFN